MNEELLRKRKVTEVELENMLRRVMRHSTLPTSVSLQAEALLQRCPQRRATKHVEPPRKHVNRDIIR